MGDYCSAFIISHSTFPLFQNSTLTAAVNKLTADLNSAHAEVCNMHFLAVLWTEHQTCWYEIWVCFTYNTYAYNVCVMFPFQITKLNTASLNPVRPPKDSILVCLKQRVLPWRHVIILKRLSITNRKIKHYIICQFKCEITLETVLHERLSYVFVGSMLALILYAYYSRFKCWKVAPRQKRFAKECGSCSAPRNFWYPFFFPRTLWTESSWSIRTNYQD